MCTRPSLLAECRYDLRRQSQLESDPHIRRVCTNEMANSMLGTRGSPLRLGNPLPRTAAAERVLTSAASLAAASGRSRLEFHAPG